MKICDYIDDFLDGALADSQKSSFEKHLADCRHCRTEIKAQEAFDQCVELAKLDVMLSAGKPFEQVELAIRKAVRRQRQTRLTIGVTVAALLVAAIGTYVASRLPSLVVNEPVVAIPETESHDLPVGGDASPQVSVELDPNSKYLAVPLKTSNPKMTILWLYPEFELDPEDPSSKDFTNTKLLLAGNP